MVHKTSLTLIISGYYGFHNSGDEAVLLSIIESLRQQAEQLNVGLEIIVLSMQPEQTMQQYGVKAIHRLQLASIAREIRRCDGVISGGGSLFQDVTGVRTIPYYALMLWMAQRLGKPTFIYAQGLGPIRRWWLRKLVKTVFHRCQYISLRDQQSSLLLQAIGIAPERIAVVPDPVMGLEHDKTIESQPQNNDDLPVIGVSLRFWREDRADLERIAHALSRLVRHRPVQLKFIPFHPPADVEASRWVIKRLLTEAPTANVTMVDVDDDPKNVLCEVGQCDVLLGMRLHSLIYGLNQYVPIVAISYDPKIEGVLASFELSPVGSTERLDVDHFIAAVDELLLKPEEWVRRNKEKIQFQKMQTRHTARTILTILLQR